MLGLQRTLLGLAFLITAVQAPAVLAAPLTLNLTYTDIDPAVLTGSGYVTFDDSLLATGTAFF